MSSAISNQFAKSNTASLLGLLSKHPSKIAFLPIKPIYAERILRGEKVFEFRRRPMSPQVSHIIVYASSPKMRIVGIVEVNQVHTGSPNKMWNMTLGAGGVTRKEYKQYFLGAEVAYAIEINPENTLVLEQELKPREIEQNFKVPQSFMYVSEQFLEAVMRSGCRQTLH